MCVVDRRSVQRVEVFRRAAALSLERSLGGVVAVGQVQVGAASERGERRIAGVLRQPQQPVLVSILVVL